MKMRWLLIAGLAWMTASCGREIPTDIIQPEEMENVLYDYHLSLGMSGNLRTSENYQKEAYKQYVFDKHRITSAEFDSSMVWYTRHSEELAAIYEKLNKRFEKEHRHLEMLLDGRQETVRISQAGDTVDVWNKKNLYWLTVAPLSNQLYFEVKADSNFHERDLFCWSVDYHFLGDGEVAMGLSIHYDNDSLVGETRHVNRSGNQTICLGTDSAYSIKSLHGFIHVMKDSAQTASVLVHNISLNRYHQPADTLKVATAAADSLGTDIKKDETVPQKQPKPKRKSDIRQRKLDAPERKLMNNNIDEPIQL